MVKGVFRSFEKGWFGEDEIGSRGEAERDPSAIEGTYRQGLEAWKGQSGMNVKGAKVWFLCTSAMERKEEWEKEGSYQNVFV